MCLCPLMFAGPLVGSYLGKYCKDFAIDKNQPFGVKALSMGLTVSLNILTVLAAKYIFKVSMCGPRGFSLIRVVVIISCSLVVGLIYNLGVNYILNRCFPLPQRRGPSCCGGGEYETV